MAFTAVCSQYATRTPSIDPSSHSNRLSFLSTRLIDVHASALFHARENAVAGNPSHYGKVSLNMLLVSHEALRSCRCYTLSIPKPREGFVYTASPKYTYSCTASGADDCSFPA